MKKLMKISLVSALGLAVALPACAQNAARKTVDVSAPSASAAPSVSTQSPLLIGSLAAAPTTSSVAVAAIVSSAQAVSSTGHTK